MDYGSIEVTTDFDYPFRWVVDRHQLGSVWGLPFGKRGRMESRTWLTLPFFFPSSPEQSAGQQAVVQGGGDMIRPHSLREKVMKNYYSIFRYYFINNIQL